MTERSNVFGPQEFVDKLRRDEITVPLTLTGIVKEVADSSTHLLFAFGTRCESWTSVPLDLIERIELVDHATCGDHSHPLVNVTLKTPQSPEIAVFASLLNASLRQRTLAGTTSHLPSTGGAQQRRRLIPLARYARAGNAGSPPIARACSECSEYEDFGELGLGTLHHCYYFPGGTVDCWYEVGG
jgi:hypothetical protein